MGIEYLPGVDVGAKIDLDRFQKNDRFKLRPEQLLPVLKEKLAQRAGEYNSIYGQDWLDDNCAIKIFQNDNESDEDETSMEEDRELVKMQEQQWATEVGKTVDKWREDKEKNPANLTEIAISLSLQRLLPENFLVVRAYSYDDYNNGVDQLIINRATGQVVCGIDEVIDRQGNSGPNKKEEKVRRKIIQGGVSVKYGALVQGGALKLGALKNIPAFYLSLDKTELTDLCAALSKEETTTFEKNLLKRLREDLYNQIRTYSALPLSKNLRTNINAFAESLASWSD